MKIIKLTIKKFRGIVDHEFNFDGGNAVIEGPNGVGKSGVVDAIDFLLTGEITRLSGEGTGDVSLIAHGPHVGYDASESLVTAKIESENGKIYTVTRTIANKSTVEIEEEFEVEFKKMVSYAQNGAHFLSRRELLNYILRTPAKRSEQIQSLLDISDLKINRDALNKLNKKTKEEYNMKVDDLNEKYTDIKKICEFEDAEDFLNNINKYRLILGGEKLLKLDKLNFMEDIPYIGKQEIEIINSLLRKFEILKVNAETSHKDANKYLAMLETIASEINDEKYVNSDVASVQLIKSGIELLKGDAKCPLCLHQWQTEDELKQVLLSRRDKNEELCDLIDKYNNSFSLLTKGLNKLYEDLESILGSLDEGALVKTIDTYLELMKNLKQKLSGLPTEYYKDNCSIRDFFNTFYKDGLITLIDESIDNYKPMVDDKTREKSDTKAALEDLQRLYRDIKEIEVQLPSLELKRNRSELLFKLYEETQEEVLNALYKSVSDLFTEYYRILHDYDEPNFIGTLENKKAAVNMRVDFYGKGLYPPVAFHSEGHQDSMGIALYFALMNTLSSSEFGLVVLDDVVMSIDIEHRKSFCKLIKDHFNNKQIIITTHDAVWAKYLLNEEIAPKKNHVIFQFWNVNEGPIIIQGRDVWKIAREKAETDLLSASSFLRHEMESYFEGICDILSAKIKYNSSYRWTYGDYMGAACERYKEILTKARRHAVHYEDITLLETIDNMQEQLKEKRRIAEVNNWVTNTLIHYNHKYSIAKSEFISAVDSLEEFCSCFECEKCGSKLTLAYEGMKPSIFKCKCGSVNLVLKN